MQIKLNLTKAFTLRKRINELANKAMNEINYNPAIVPEEEVESAKAKYEFGSYDENLKFYEMALDASTDVSNGIEKANVDGKIILNKINKINTKINEIESCIRNLNASTVRKDRNPVTGVWEKIEAVRMSNIDYTQHLKELKQEKVRLEDELSTFNSSTNFTVDIPDSIYKRIYG